MTTAELLSWLTVGNGLIAAACLSTGTALAEDKIGVEGSTTVRDLVGRYPQTRPVFEQFGIDYCCGGGQTLAVVAQKHHLELPTLVAALEKALQTQPEGAKPIDKDWYAAPLDELVQHIVDVHHAYLKKELPRLGTLEQRVLRAHAAHHGEMLRHVHDLFVALEKELSSHTAKEEKEVFPQIIAAVARPMEKDSRPLGKLVGELEQEHETAGAALAKLREVTGKYTLPADACPTFRALYEGLQALEADLHQHIHLENNILFPRALKLTRDKS
jgi:regulator of cell morphogenesis and NO signaling